jgi:outer membrane protein OmpA-like peptidoglycan-associated protein
VNGLKEGYYPGIDSFSTPKVLFKNDTIYKTFYLDPIEKKRYVVENVYYAFDKSVVRPEYFTILDSVLSLMKIFPNVFLKIDGHTDGRGTEVYNQALSERRCKAAAEYLLEKGLAPERIIMRGYSELVPIAPNTTPSGEDDPAGRAKNRRVEFKLLSPNGRDPKYDIDYRVNVPFGIE